MKTFYFTFGQTHVHSVNGFTYDKDIVVVINSESEIEARKIMFDHFGEKWGFCYIRKPNMDFFPRGFKQLP